MTTQMNIVKRVAGISGIVIFSLVFCNSMYAQKSILKSELLTSSSNLFLKSSAEIINAFYSKNEAFYEEEIQLEDWMIDLEKFGKKLDSSSVEIKKEVKSTSNEEFIQDEELNLEGWMLEYDWNYTGKDIFNEEDFALESWMTEPKSW